MSEKIFLRTENKTLFIPKRQQRLLNDNEKKKGSAELEIIKFAYNA